MTTPDQNLWIGPVVLAAVISSAITALNWIVAPILERRAARARRAERVRDAQEAIHAEIRMHVLQLRDFDYAAARAIYPARIRDGSFQPSYPREKVDTVFTALVEDIALIDSGAIQDVVAYYAQIAAIGLFVQDLRRLRPADSTERRAQMFVDYLEMRETALKLGLDALARLRRALSKTDRDLSAPGDWAAGPWAAARHPEARAWASVFRP